MRNRQAPRATRSVVSLLCAIGLVTAGCSTPDATSTDSSGRQSAAIPASHGSASSPGEGTVSFPHTYKNCGADVTVDKTPQHAVALNQSATELLLRLGLGDRLAGTGYQTNPVPDNLQAAYDKVPLLNDGIVKHETLLKAQPDFVYSSYASFLTSENAGERSELHKLGVPTYLTEFDCSYHQSVKDADFDMLFDEVRTISKVFDVPKAGDDFIAAQQRVIDSGLRKAKQIEGKPKLVWFYSTAASKSTPSVAGPGGLPQKVTEMLGAKNLFDDGDTKWPEVSWDEIAKRDPDVIVLGDLTRGYPGDSKKEKIDFLKSDPLTSKMDAVKHNRFITVSGPEMDPSIQSVNAVTHVADGLMKLQQKENDS